MSENKTNTTALTPGIIFIIGGIVLYFFSDSFGPESLMQMIGAIAILIGVPIVGMEITERSDDPSDIGTNMGIGSGIIFFGTMSMTAIPILPNFLILITILLGGAFIVESIISLSGKKNYKMNLTFRIIIILGQISSSIVSIIELINLFS